MQDGNETEDNLLTVKHRTKLPRSENMSDKYRVGIIGCGSIANYHARGYQGVKEVEIVAIADPVEGALNDFGE